MLRGNGKRAGRSRERLQTLCESDPEGRKKGKLYIALQEILQFNRVERDLSGRPPDKIAHQRNTKLLRNGPAYVHFWHSVINWEGPIGGASQVAQW